jgi:hypothetical protein
VDPLERSIGQMTERPDEIVVGTVVRRTVTVLDPFEYTAELSTASVTAKRAVVQAESLMDAVSI